MAIGLTDTYVSELQAILGKLPTHEIERICQVLYRAYEEDKTVFLFGNGGSAALASHMACDLGKGTFAPTHIPLPGIKRFRALSLTDNLPMLSAWANDTSYEDVFAEQLANFVQPGDVAFGISGSGNSMNVIKALQLAKRHQAVTVVLTGFSGGKVKDIADHAIVVRSNNMQQIEDMHLIMAHVIFLNLQKQICNGAESSSLSGELREAIAVKE